MKEIAIGNCCPTTGCAPRRSGEGRSHERSADFIHGCSKRVVSNGGDWNQRALYTTIEPIKVK